MRSGADIRKRTRLEFSSSSVSMNSDAFKSVSDSKDVSSSCSITFPYWGWAAGQWRCRCCQSNAAPLKQERVLVLVCVPRESMQQELVLDRPRLQPRINV